MVLPNDGAFPRRGSSPRDRDRPSRRLAVASCVEPVARRRDDDALTRAATLGLERLILQLLGPRR